MKTVGEPLSNYVVGNPETASKLHLRSRTNETAVLGVELQSSRRSYCFHRRDDNLTDGVKNGIAEIPSQAVSMKQIACRLLLAMVSLTLVAPMRFPTDEAVAQSPLPVKTVDDKIADEASEFRKMIVTARDEHGDPLPGTKIKVMVLQTAGKKTMPQTQDYFTGGDGRAEVKLPQDFFYMRVLAYRSKYVAMSATFDHETDGLNKGSKDIAAKVPTTFDFVLKPGIKLGGTVIDETGQPIPGVKVRVSSSSVGLGEATPLPSTNPKPMPDDPYGAVVTNPDGHWDIDELRERTPEIEYHLQLQHDDYISDTNFGGLQREQGVTTETLVTGNSKIVMKTGPRITGTVVDSAGQPVTKGVVIWHIGTFGSPEFEARLNDQGEFRSKVLKSGDYQVTIAAPGFTPESRVVQIVDRLEKADFVLQPGKRIAIRIQDAEGHPLPGALVRIDSWRRIGALRNARTDLDIPSRSNDDGVYVWDWAPTDAVTYRISVKQDRGDLFEVASLVAQVAEHVVTLRPPLTFSGTVTDAVTGNPVEEFVAIPVRVTQPKWLWTSYRQAKTSRTGHYEIHYFPDSQDGLRFHIRVEAKGYRTAISEKSYARADGSVTLDFAMQPAAAAAGRVINSAGELVVGAFVIQATPTVKPMMPNGTISEPESSVVLTTDEYGRFRIAASFEPARIRVIHPEGFAEVVRQIDERPGTLTLQPWAKVSGTLLQNGVPVPNQSIQFNPIIHYGTDDLQFQDFYAARTDAKGHFEFERLPPTVGFVTSPIGLDSPLLSLRPGENRTVSLGGVGVSVTGKVVTTRVSDVESTRQSSLCYLIRRGPGSLPPADSPLIEFDLTKRLRPSCARDDSFDSWLATKDAYFLLLSPDGDFHVSSVPAGEYDLLLEMIEQSAGGLAETIGRRIVPIVVTDSDLTAGTKDAGRLEVDCRVGPRVGQSMQNNRFVDTDGRERSIDDLRGHYVLLHVWASSCSTCVEVLPEIQSTRQRSMDKRIRFIGWNIDENPDLAKSIVLKNKWDWPQTYLGGNSDQVKQLAISHVPAYYLINHDGLLVAATESWSTMAKKIDELK